VIPLGDQDERPGLPIVNLAIIVLNVLVFFYQLVDPSFTNGYSTVPAEITTGHDIVGTVQLTLPDGSVAEIDEAAGPNPLWLTLFTSMFMHGGWLHIGGNMLFLFIFGDNIEKTFGSLRYLAFYLVCGLIAGLAHVASDTSSVIPSLGASGAISGVMAAYLVLYPQNQIRALITLGYFVTIRMVPAVLMIGIWALLQFVSGIGSLGPSVQTTGVAYWAHIGGFVAGALITLVARPFIERSAGGPRYSVG
jgi:membrane associated rhomboid family serine protease